MQEFSQRRACAPAAHLGAQALLGALGGFVEAADQRRQHVTVGGVVVVARPIEIGGHQADGVESVLPAQRLAQLEAGDLGDRIPLVGGLERPGEQGFLPNRLLGEFGVDAATAQKQQPSHARAPSALDHVGLDLEVVQQEIGRVGGVGVDAANLGGRQHHHRGLLGFKPAGNGRPI